MKKNRSRAFTTIEILIAIAVLVIILGVALPRLSTMREGEVMKGTLEEVAAAIEKAKSESLSSVGSSEYGVHFEESMVVIFAGTSYSAGAATNVEIQLQNPAIIESIDLSPSGDSLYFDRLSGEPSKSGSITIDVGGSEKTITISPTGSVSTQ